MKLRTLIGAYYFDGWAGQNKALAQSNEPWAENAPTHLTRRMVREFPQREPVWGWRDDSLPVMEKQIELAADHGIGFFAFCWYWHDNGRGLNEKEIMADPKHTSLQLFLRAANKRRMKFCLLIANHGGYQISGMDNWHRAGAFLAPLLANEQYLQVGGKPLIIIFNPDGCDRRCLAAMDDAARQAGLPGLAVSGCGNATLEKGFTLRTHYAVVPGYEGGSQERTYAELAAATRASWGAEASQQYMPLVMAGWDKRPWEGPDGLNQKQGWYYPDRTPEQFATLLRDAIAWLDAHPGQTPAERIVMIYAWNEFGEGGYIAPTRGDPDAMYLRAVKSATTPGA